MGATTDSEMCVKYDEVNKPGISNLITIYASVTGKSIPDIEKEFLNANYGAFKKAVADVVCSLISKIQDRYNELINSEELDRVLDNGIVKARVIAKAKYLDMKNKMGLKR